MTKGIIYYNKGKKCVTRIIVSLMTLRKHYDGPVTVFLERGNLDLDVMDRLEKDFKDVFSCDVIRDDNPDTTTYVRAVEVCMKAPYDLNLWMDADTIILGDISEFFEKAKNHDLVIANFAGWKTTGRTISGRIKRYKDIVPEYIDEAIKYGPAINCGVYGFPKNSPMLKEWLEVAKQGEQTGMFIPDEVACQVLLPQYNCAILSQKYNVSVIHDRGTKDQRVLHYHGRKHCKDFPACEMWIKEFISCLETDLCGIRKYIGRDYGDRRLRGFLKGNYSWDKYVAAIKEILKKPPQDSRSSKDDKNGEIDPSEVTLVTACDPKYIEALRLTWPNWQKYKGIDKYEAIVFVNGMKIEDSRLDFLRGERVRLIPWEMSNVEDHREEMLSAFVLGTSKYVKTPYWLKLDADSYATDDKPLLYNWMKDYAFCGHKWGYSWEKHIKALDKWAAKHSLRKLKNAEPVYDKKCVNGRRYGHPEKRTISFVQLQCSNFTRLCANLAGGERLPVPSHDTYLFYIARQLGFTWKSHNFKRKQGFTQANGRRGADSIRKKMEKDGVLV